MSFKDFLKKCAIVIRPGVAGAGLGLVVGAATGGIVGATAAAIDAVAAAIDAANDAAIEVFFGASSGTLMSAEDIDPLSTVLANHGRSDLLDPIRSAVKTGNANAMDNIGKQLTKLGLDYIYEAFKRAIRDNLRCSKCRKNVASLDDLCYLCPGAATNCHHNCKKCCVHRRERGMFGS